MSDFEARVDEVSHELMTFFNERCEIVEQPGKANALLFALAAAQVIGSNFSLVPSGAAEKAFTLTEARMRHWHEMGREAARTAQ